MAVVVIEAGETSGALITAAFAAEQGREVCAVPGNIIAPQSKGTNIFIANGARPRLSPQQALAALDLTHHVERREIRHVVPGDHPTEAALLNIILSQQPVHVDEIRTQSGLPIEQVSATLTIVKLKGLVRQVGGMNYVAVRESQADYNA